jgi:hypothetical protein
LNIFSQFPETAIMQVLKHPLCRADQAYGTPEKSSFEELNHLDHPKLGF